MTINHISDKRLCHSNKLSPCLLLKGYKLLRYELFCRFIPLIFKYFSQNAHGVINIHEYYNMNKMLSRARQNEMAINHISLTIASCLQ